MVSSFVQLFLVIYVLLYIRPISIYPYKRARSLFNVRFIAFIIFIRECSAKIGNDPIFQEARSAVPYINIVIKLWKIDASV